EEDDSDLEDRGDENLTRMKSGGRRHIEVEVGGMHDVESPEQRNHMVGAMKQVRDQVEKDDLERYACPRGQAQPTKRPEIRSEFASRREHVTRGTRERHDDPVDGAESEVGQPACS